MWYCFVVGATRYGFSNANTSVGHVGRGDDTTQKDTKFAIVYIYSNVSGWKECSVKDW